MKLTKKKTIIISLVTVYILFWAVTIFQGFKNQNLCIKKITTTSVNGKTIEYKRIEIPESLDSFANTNEPSYWTEMYCPFPFLIIFRFGTNNLSEAYDSKTYYLDFFGFTYIIKEKFYSKNYDSVSTP